MHIHKNSYLALFFRLLSASLHVEAINEGIHGVGVDQTLWTGEFAQILKRVLEHRWDIPDQLCRKQAEPRAKIEETRRRLLSRVCEMRMRRQCFART